MKQIQSVREISYQRIRPKKSHVGFVSFVFNGIKLRNIAVHLRQEPKNGMTYRLVYPANNSTKRFMFNPIDRTTSERIEREINLYLQEGEKDVSKKF